MDHSTALAIETVKSGKQAIIFAESKRSAEKSAEEISKALRRLKSEQYNALSDSILKSLSNPTKQCVRLASCIKLRVAFHHAGLIAKQRELIEEEFRKGAVKIICATPTLAMGLDLPAFRVILKNLRRYSGAWGMAWIPVLEYLQMAGRAGRPKYHDTYGEAIAIAKTKKEHDEIHARYIMGKPEAIFSKLAVEPVLRTYVLSLIATGFVFNRAHLVNFFSKTFWAHQYKDMDKLSATLDKMVVLLESWDFLEKPGDFISAAEINKERRLTATLLGKRVAELYIDPYTANHLIKGLRKAKDPNALELLQLISHTLEMRPLLNAKVGDYESIQKEIMQNELLEAPSTYDISYDEFINSMKTALFLNDWIEEKNEEDLLEKYSIRPGEIYAKKEIADWLIYAMEELIPLLGLKHLGRHVRKLRMRVNYGAKEELLALLQLEGIGRVRARKLWNNGIKDIGDVKKADISTLSQLIGMKVANDVKKQVGQEVEIVKNKRKGQIGLGKY